MQKMGKIQESPPQLNNTIIKFAHRLENNRMAAQRSRRRKKNVLKDLDKKVMALSRARDELVAQNRRLLLGRKRRKKELEIAKREQMQLTDMVWTSFLACKVATEELKRCVFPTRGVGTRKSTTGLFQNERSFDLMGQNFLNLLQTSKQSATTTTESVSMLASGCGHEDPKPPCFKIGDDASSWKHLGGAVSF